MPYTPPTAATFKVRYPEFAAVPDATVTAILGEAALEVGPSWIEDDRAPAQMALTAHLLVMQGALGGLITSADGSSVQTSGPVSRVKVGDVETTFSSPSGSSGGSEGGSQSEYALTAYGRRFLRYLRRSFPPVAVV